MNRNTTATADLALEGARQTARHLQEQEWQRNSAAALDYSYLAQKMDQARSSLLPPHPEGEAGAFSDSFFMCSIVSDMLEQLAAKDGEAPGKYARTIVDAINMEGVEPDPNGRGTGRVKAARMSSDDLLAYSKAVDNLATWLIVREWSDRA